MPEQSVEKLSCKRRIALEEFGGDLSPILKRPLAQAKKALKRFPAIGDPGAEKILLFCRAFPILALESNGLLLLRLGFGEEKPNYSVTYHLVQEAIAYQLVQKYPSSSRPINCFVATDKSYAGGQSLSAQVPLSKECPWTLADAGN